ncbi:hypothetical protein L211DRAFT_840731 [Terfezia boudieri ATCC MYA-4762]|uniref:Uncharacterized protein n=1 Tax=Terfezia boudieri ATCC MYA-4762 TaxID=1051890 RepID=A0A3N4LIP5_9PEZI|nr:hypothetical protein L211DRAFT_840731 [Terfezia boudieri ATCC MYA-4762]
MCLDLAQVEVHIYREQHRLRFPNMIITSAGIVGWLTRYRSLYLSYSLACLGDGPTSSATLIILDISVILWCA